MLPVILGILKIIGIVLLILLAVFLFLVLAILFVPIRYGITGKLNGEVKQADMKVTWLLKLIRFKLNYIYPENPSVSLKILWIDIWKIMNKPKKEPKGKKKEKKKKEKNTIKPAEDCENLTTTNVNEAEAESSQSIKESENISEPPLTELSVDENKGGVKEKVEKIIFKITTLYDKIKDIKNNIQYYLDILQEKETQELLKDSKVLMLKIWKSAGPKVFRINGRFGFETPDTTGRMYGYYCMAIPYIGEYILLEPEFEGKILEADCVIKGKITIFVILINGLKIYFDKRLQKLISKLRDGGKKNG